MNIYLDLNNLDVEDRPHYVCNRYILQVKSINSGSRYENIKIKSLTERIIEELEALKETFAWGRDNGYLTPKNAVSIIETKIKELRGE